MLSSEHVGFVNDKTNHSPQADEGLETRAYSGARVTGRCATHGEENFPKKSFA
jgi:hypothetical protein